MGRCEAKRTHILKNFLSFREQLQESFIGSPGKSREEVFRIRTRVPCDVLPGLFEHLLAD